VTDPNHRYVDYGRWEEAHRALTERVADLEREMIPGLEQRLTHLERAVGGWQERQDQAQLTRRTRAWQVALAVVTGLVLPLATIGLVALFHLE